MPIGPIELNGMVSRTQDFQNIKNQENQKPVFDNLNYTSEVKKNVNTNVNNVHNKDEALLSHQDSNQSKNEYAGDGGRQRNKKKDGKVIDKSVHSFDIKI